MPWRLLPAADCAGFCAACWDATPAATARRLLEVSFGHLQVAFGGDGGRVAQPSANDMDGVAFGQFGLPAGPQVMEQLRPSCEPRPRDDPFKLSPQVDAIPAVACGLLLSELDDRRVMVLAYNRAGTL